MVSTHQNRKFVIVSYWKDEKRILGFEVMYAEPGKELPVAIGTTYYLNESNPDSERRVEYVFQGREEQLLCRLEDAAPSSVEGDAGYRAYRLFMPILDAWVKSLGIQLSE